MEFWRDPLFLRLVFARRGFYAIQPGRGFEEAATVLGADFAGILARVCAGIERQFRRAGAWDPRVPTS